MPKCPECGKEINYLIFSGEEYVTATVSLRKNGTIDYTNWNSCGGFGDIMDYSCPECHAILFDNEEDAEAFLRGELDEIEEEN